MRLEDFLSQNAEKRRYPAGQAIFSKGDQAGAAFYITEGRVEIHDGAGAVMAVLGAGEIFGEMALLRFDEYTLSARALGDTDVHVITPDMLHAQIRVLHPLVRLILDTLVDRMHGVNSVLIDLDRAARP